MSSMDKIGFNLGRRDEIPNQELAKELASAQDRAGIQEIAENLWNKNTNIRGDCIKVMYEIGYLDPDLIADYYPDFIRLLISKQNRLVWGGMIALSTIASIKARELSENLPAIQKAIREGSVITVDAGVKRSR